MPPRVSILVTCYQQARWVQECLESIAAQTYDDWELLVLDDASPDPAVVERVEAWIAAHPEADARLLAPRHNLGVTRLLNWGLPQARGDLIAYCGADDLWAPTRLERQVEALDAAGPGTAVVYADARLIDRDGGALEPSFIGEGEPRPTGEVFHALLARNFVPTPAVLYRRSAIEAVGGWDPDLYYEDWDLLLRLADRYHFTYVDEVLAAYRIHDESMTRRSFSSMLDARLTTLGKWIGRDAVSAEIIVPELQAQSWRLFKVFPDRARGHVALAYARPADLTGRARRLVATSRPAELGFEVLRRLSRPFRRTGRPARSA